MTVSTEYVGQNVNSGLITAEKGHFDSVISTSPLRYRAVEIIIRSISGGGCSACYVKEKKCVLCKENKNTHSGESGVDGSGGTFLDNPAENSKHSNAAMLQLSLAEDLYVENLREAEGVETNITRQGAIKVGGLLKEGN